MLQNEWKVLAEIDVLAFPIYETQLACAHVCMVGIVSCNNPDKMVQKVAHMPRDKKKIDRAIPIMSIELMHIFNHVVVSGYYGIQRG